MADKSDIVLWETLADKNAENHGNTNAYILLAIVTFFLGSPLLNPIFGGAAAAWLLYKGWKVNNEKIDQMEAVEEGVCCHLYDKQDFWKYLTSAGEGEVRRQLKEAIARELPLSKTATDTAKRMGLISERKSINPLRRKTVEVEASTALPEQPTASDTASDQVPVSSDTRSFEQSPGPELLPEPSLSSKAAATDQPSKIPMGILRWNDAEHLVMIGLSGSAKTTALLQCIPANSAVVYITLKTDDTAPKHWKAYRLSKRADYQFLKQLYDLCEYIDSLMDLAEQGTKHRLVIDEALTIHEHAKTAVKVAASSLEKDEAYLKSVPARWEAILGAYIRTGRSDGHYLGLVTQSPNGTDLFQSAKTMQGLKTVLCAAQESSNKFDYLVDWAKQLYGQKLTTSDIEQLAEIKSGYWHFWLEGKRLHAGKTLVSTIERVPCQMFPTAGVGVEAPQANDDTIDWEEAGWNIVAAIRRGCSARLALSQALGQDFSGGGPAWEQAQRDLAENMDELPRSLQSALRQELDGLQRSNEYQKPMIGGVYG